VELPYLVDSALQNAVTTPDLDSHANEMSQLKTELFIAHYNLRLIGYACFALMVLLIVAGFVTRKTGLAAIGGLAFMLPVFAQFAGVMFFLAGLGLLNVLWLPVLDISFDLAALGSIIRVPYDLLRWPFRQLGLNPYWPIVYFFLGVGLLIFFLGTFAWLSARARKQDVADFWVYRISRHPQYLGWIIWSYGVYLLLLRGLYPKRSWGIDASLPWLISTLTIIGVAMLEELNMRRRHGEAYEAYRRSAPFLLPLPESVKKLFALPFRALFGKYQPERRREVAVVLSLYAVVLIGASALFYRGGLARTTEALTTAEGQRVRMEELATQLIDEPNWRTKYSIAERLAGFGDPAVDHLIPLLDSEQPEVRILAADYLRRIPSERAVPALVLALEDSAANVRGNALRALGAIGAPDCTEPMLRLLDDEERWVRNTALRSLAQLRASEVIESALALLEDPDVWTRIASLESLGILGSQDALPAIIAQLKDEEPRVRRAAVVALLKIGSPEARDALTQATTDDDWEVRIYATEALRHLPARSQRSAR
jgi:protein-S-isoprenylcysteine O-methyltransferase Ste14